MRHLGVTHPTQGFSLCSVFLVAKRCDDAPALSRPPVKPLQVAQRSKTAALSLKPPPLQGFHRAGLSCGPHRCSREPPCVPPRVSRSTRHFQPFDNVGQPNRDTAGIHYPQVPKQADPPLCSGSVFLCSCQFASFLR